MNRMRIAHSKVYKLPLIYSKSRLMMVSMLPGNLNWSPDAYLFSRGLGEFV